MSSLTEQIKEKLDIVEFLKSYLELKSAGRNFKAPCPFHKEKTPSFMVSPDRQSWHCFGGCNEGGDIFKFLMKYENLEFHEALKILAEKAGINLRKEFHAADYQQYNVLYEINNSAKDFYKKNLNDHALTYLYGRGLKKQLIEEFELGYAPAGTDTLVRYLLNLGFSIQDIDRAGFAFKTDRGTYWDRFRQRIMFPINNSFGKTVGFTGRFLPYENQSSAEVNQAKYLNSPETPIFNKSRLLYNLDKSKTVIRGQNWSLLVEGQMDVLMCWQDGVKNTIASSGTALTTDHLKTLRRLTDRLILCFDNDEAGQLATERAIDLAIVHDFTVRILHLTGKDPADIVQAQPGQLINIIKQGETAIDFYLRRYLTSETLSKESLRKKNIRLILSKIKNQLTPLDQTYWLKELSTKTAVSEIVLLEEMKKISNPKNPALGQSTADQKQSFSRKELLLARIFDLGGQIENQLPPSSELSLKASLINSTITPDQKPQELQLLLKQFKIEQLKDRQRLFQLAIATAEKTNDQPALASALQEFDIIAKELHNFTNDKS